MVITNSDTESVLYLYSKSGKQLSRLVIPSKLPSTAGYKNRYLYLDPQGKLVWNTINGEYYSGAAIDIDTTTHIVSLLYDDTYFKIVDGKLTINLETVATKDDLEKKQDKIEFIEVSSLSGIIPIDELYLLVKNRVNRIVYQNAIYYFSIKQENIYKYFTTVQTTEYNEIDVDTDIGKYEIKSTLAPQIKEHIENSHIHITDIEREF